MAFVSVPVVGGVKPWQLVFLLIGLAGLKPYCTCVAANRIEAGFAPATGGHP